jgi:hypothetical protein
VHSPGLIDQVPRWGRTAPTSLWAGLCAHKRALGPGMHGHRTGAMRTSENTHSRTLVNTRTVRDFRDSYE